MSEAPLRSVENISPRKPDAVLAANLRAAATGLIGQLCALMDEAGRDGLVLNFQINRDAYGRHQPTISIAKPL